MFGACLLLFACVYSLYLSVLFVVVRLRVLIVSFCFVCCCSPACTHCIFLFCLLLFACMYSLYLSVLFVVVRLHVLIVSFCFVCCCSPACTHCIFLFCLLNIVICTSAQIDHSYVNYLSSPRPEYIFCLVSFSLSAVINCGKYSMS